MLGVRELPVAAGVDRARRRAVGAVGVVIGALAVVTGWGLVLQARGADLHLGAVPFYGAWSWQATWYIVVPVGLAAAIVTGGPRFAARARWPALMVASWIATVVWSIALAASAGWHAVSAPVASRFDYRPALPVARVGGLGTFLRTYTERLGDYPVHVQGHPPGMVALLWVLDAVGLRGPGWEAAVIIGVGATTAAAVLVTVRLLGGEAAARPVAPFLVVAPWTLFVATIGDAVFTALAAWSVALVAIAATRPRERGGGAVGAVAVAVLAGGLGALT